MFINTLDKWNASKDHRTQNNKYLPTFGVIACFFQQCVQVLRIYCMQSSKDLQLSRVLPMSKSRKMVSAKSNADSVPTLSHLHVVDCQQDVIHAPPVFPTHYEHYQIKALHFPNQNSCKVRNHCLTNLQVINMTSVNQTKAYFALTNQLTLSSGFRDCAH